MGEWKCLEKENVNYGFFVDQKVTFDQAVSFCEQQDATLARVSTASEYVFVATHMVTLGGDKPFWIGLRANSLVTDESDPRRFEYIDGFEDSSFYATPSQFPWKNRRPDGDNSSARADCVEWTPRTDVNDEAWDDNTCSKERRVLCRRLCVSLTVAPSTTEITTSPTPWPPVPPTTPFPTPPSVGVTPQGAPVDGTPVTSAPTSSVIAESTEEGTDSRGTIFGDHKFFSAATAVLVVLLLLLLVVYRRTRQKLNDVQANSLLSIRVERIHR